MKRTNILLAEDDLDDYNFFVEALEKLSPSFNVFRAKNGLECLTFLKTKEKPHLIFIDLNIPLKNGLECLKLIKNNETLAEIPVIVYSTSHYIKHIDAAFKNGAHSYIVKPNNANELIEILTTVLNRLEEGSQFRRKEDFVVRKVVTLQN